MLLEQLDRDASHHWVLMEICMDEIIDPWAILTKSLYCLAVILWSLQLFLISIAHIPPCPLTSPPFNINLLSVYILSAQVLQLNLQLSFSHHGCLALEYMGVTHFYEKQISHFFGKRLQRRQEKSFCHSGNEGQFVPRVISMKTMCGMAGWKHKE